ncbi:glycosyltransferase family 4 protein [Acinetobacter gandensis]|uniref:Glycosyltransferase WbuB n=1 Tax=Acinetobacter gandensis TaxID=1443941 RepID=A0A1A7R9Y4_9GAMM|nr:glycosyltransferase family 4 protein [Acinetobacter gandensis]KAB0625204.1 glycosyltransferase family 4 protein [Acinetobacter gandensis]OBX28278.1 glycosyltransferase WbuB [Acinetobacter gandensis]
MKIIYLHQYFNTPQMSGGTRSYEMAKRLVAAGHEVHMITSWVQETNHLDWFNEEIDGIKVHWFPNPYSNKMSYKQRIQAFLRFAYASMQKIATIPADIVFATSTPLTIAIPGVLGARKQKIPMIFEVRDLWPEVPIAMGILKKPYQIFLAKKLEKWAYKNSAHIVALSPGMKEGVIATGYPENQVSIIPNSCDNDLFEVQSNDFEIFKSHNAWLPEGDLIIYTGTFGIVNDVGIAVDLAKELKNRQSSISILLIGDGLEFDKVYKRAINEDVLNQTLYIRKQVPKTEIPYFLKYAAMASSFAINIPAIQANSANKFFDALAASKPILINYGGWQKDIIENNQCGLVAWGKSIKETIDDVENFLNNKEKYNQACRNAKSLALNDFSRDMLAKKLEAILIEGARKQGKFND